jgi:ERCC4-type nuclease
MATADPTTPIACPFAVLVDRREQRPFSFTGLRADARQGRRPILVTVVPATLGAGDYSLSAGGLDCGDRVAVERKSLADLYGTLGQRRECFEQELARLQRLDFAAVVVEADWVAILKAPPARSQLNPKTVYRSILAWMQRFQRVHWVLGPNRQFAEVTTFRILERFYKTRVARAGGED